MNFPKYLKFSHRLGTQNTCSLSPHFQARLLPCGLSLNRRFFLRVTFLLHLSLPLAWLPWASNHAAPPCLGSYPPDVLLMTTAPSASRLLPHVLPVCPSSNVTENLSLRTSGRSTLPSLSSASVMAFHLKTPRFPTP